MADTVRCFVEDGPMLHAITYNLPKAAKGHATGGQAAAKPADDYAQRHADAFGAKRPSKADSGDKLSLSWQIDEATRLNLKPSLKKGGSLKVELKIKF
jgi:hypothetical protein